MKPTKIFIASDHAGFPLKKKVTDFLIQQNFTVEDLGPLSEERCDYPDFATLVSQSINEETHYGVLMCGSGQGMAMRANKFPHIRAALCWNRESAQLSRQHNNANVLCFGARLLTEEVILDLTEAFFNTEFEGGRHQSRVNKISSPI